MFRTESIIRQAFIRITCVCTYGVCYGVHTERFFDVFSPIRVIPKFQDGRIDAQSCYIVAI